LSIVTIILSYIFKPNISTGKKNDMTSSQRKKIVHVGYSEPVDNQLAFNFHICIEDREWVETIDYFTIFLFDSTINRECDDFKHIQFLCFDNDELHKILKILISNEFSFDNLKVLERYRKITETWINFVFDNLQKLQDECKQVLKQHFFRSQDKISSYEAHFYNSVTARNPNSKPTNRDSIVNMASAAIPNPKKLMKRVSITFGAKIDKFALPSDESGKTKKRSIFGGSNVGVGRIKALIPDKSEVGDDVNKFAATGKGGDDGAKPKMILKVEVQRGHEEGRGVLSYEIFLRVIPGRRNRNSNNDKKSSFAPDGPSDQIAVVHTISQRYSNFRKLLTQLTALNDHYANGSQANQLRDPNSKQTESNESQSDSNPNGLPRAGSPYEDFLEIITAPFPFGLKSYLGISLNDTDLSMRTRMLDTWIRDICYNYRHFPPSAKQLVRDFLHFDMSVQKDIFVQDQLAWGLIEAPRGPPPMLIMQQSALQGEGVEGLLAHIDDNCSSVESSYSGVKSKVSGAGSVFGFGSGGGASANGDGLTSLQSTIADTMRGGSGDKQAGIHSQRSMQSMQSRTKSSSVI
jgi:Tfp pilus assembly protein PilP